MTDLDDQQLQTIAQQLAERAAVLQAEVRAARDAAEQSGAAEPQLEDAVGRSEERFRRGMEHVDLQRDQEELRAIDAARERIADGSYGECVDCSKPIPFERLLVQPTALRDVAHQPDWERRNPSAPAFTV